MISVVMATYNGAEYIIEQLDTIRKQTKAPDEVVICDDRSTDGTVSIVKNYIKKYHLEDFWKIYVNEKNLGYGNNFYHAVSLSHGDYIFFSDQDDLWENMKIEIMLHAMEKFPDCSVLCTDYEPFSVSMDAPQVPDWKKRKMPNDGTIEKISFNRKNIYIGALGCCMSIRRDFYESISKYWYDSWAHDDRLWKLSNIDGGCYVLHSNLLKHRLHNNNTATFAKNHEKTKRIMIFKKLRNAAFQTHRFAVDNCKPKKDISILANHFKMFDLRIELMEKKQILNLIKLIRYLPYYERARSYLIEAAIAMRK